MKALWICVLLSLSGCLSMSDSEKKEHLASSPTLEKSQQQGIDSGVFVQGPWPDKDWWSFFESPLLSHWIEEAFSKNPNLQSLESWIEQARQIAKVSEAKLFPTLFFDAQDNYRYFGSTDFLHLVNPSLPLNGYQVDLSLAFNYEFDFWNKNRNMFKAAIGEMKAREAEFCEAQLIVSTSLSQAYFALLTTKQKKELYQELVAVRKNRFQLEEQLQRSALLSALPPLLSDEGVKESEQMVLAMQDEIEIQSHLINVLMGRGPDVELDTGDILKNPPKVIPLPENLSVNLLARRPDLMAQIWRADSLSREVSVAKADFFPNINIAAFAGLSATAWSSLFQNSAHTVGYLPALKLPMFTAGSIRANVRAKKAAFDQAIFQYNNLLLTSTQEVADLLSNVQTVYKQKALQENVVLYAQKRLDLTFLRQEGGLDSQFAILDYEEALIEKKIKEVDFTYHQYAFVIKLIKSLGGGYLFSYVPISLEES